MEKRFSIVALALLQLVHFPSFSKDALCKDSPAEMAARPPSLASETSLISPATTGQYANLAGLTHVGGANMQGLNAPGSMARLPAQPSLHPLAGTLKPPEQIQLPISTPSVSTAAGLKRVTLSPTMRALQVAHGMDNGVDKPAACSTNVTLKWMDQSDLLAGLSSVPASTLVRQYLADPAAFASKYTPKLALHMIAYIASAKVLMAKCFSPAEDSVYERSHGVLRQMGTISVGDVPVCTGLLMGSARYVITARHCFTGFGSAAANPIFWFQPARSQDRFQICAVAEPSALTTVKKNAIELDQVLVRVADTGIAAKAVQIASPQAVLTTDDETTGNVNAPTLIKNFSFLPLAKLLMPNEYKSGFAESAAAYCAAVKTMKGCFSHVCNAVAGGSGSPLFAAHAPAITLVGTHVGGSTEKGLNCKAAMGTVTNSAVLINQGYSPDVFRSN